MIIREDRGPIAVVRMAHGKVNALDVELLEAVDQELRAIEKSDIAAVVLTGTGTAFSAGVDLFRVVDGGAGYLDAFLPQLDRTLLRLFRFARPLVAAINGHAIAGGYVLAACADHRIMATGKARAGVPELMVGVPFPAAAIEVVRYAVPPARFSRTVLEGQTFVAAEALEWGLVDELVEPESLLDAAVRKAQRLAAIPRETFAITKRQFRLDAERRIEATAAATGENIARVWRDPATRDVIRGYLEQTVGKK